MKRLREDPDIAVWSRITNETKTLEHKLQKLFTCRNQISNNKLCILYSHDLCQSYIPFFFCSQCFAILPSPLFAPIWRLSTLNTAGLPSPTALSYRWNYLRRVYSRAISLYCRLEAYNSKT